MRPTKKFRKENIFMKDVLIWKINNSTISKIDKLANKKGVSRNEFIVSYFNYISEIDNLFCVFNKYEILLKRVEQSLEENRKIIERIDF